MNKQIGFIVLTALLSSASVNFSFAQDTKVFTIKTNEVKAKVAPTMWGLFFEDINQGADGGLYAELVKNRSFEFDVPMMGWKEKKDDQAKGSFLILNKGSLNPANRRYVKLESTAEGRYGLSNEGFKGIGIRQGKQYNFSVLARQHAGNTAGLLVELVDEKGAVIGTVTVKPDSPEWKTYQGSFTTTATVNKATLNVELSGKGGMDLDMISLFPQDTWKQRKNGLRADMVQLLADMKPGFLRFPGGCIVEGRNLDERFQWKKTIGKIEDRELIVNRWNMEFKHRLAPDYFQSFGLGFFEYFQLCEDIGAFPLPILNAGMACQFNTGEVVPLDLLEPYIQDALDLIEFANGSAQSEWGKKRAEMGHPAAFNLTMLGVGNENWGPQYIERLTAFTKAIKAKYPDMKIVNSSGTDPNGDRFDFLNNNLRSMNVDVIDEHYYRAPKWFLDNAKRYDNYDRKGPKIFAGEYAAQSVAIASPDNKNNWNCAMSEAAFMTGLERNADVVVMASYAPLFAHAEGWQWTPDLIWVDNLRSYGTANYQVQKLFSVNKGTDVVPVLLNNEAVSGQDGYYASATIDRKTNELILKVVNSTGKKQSGAFLIDGAPKVQSKGTMTVLSSTDLDQVNSFETPGAISPVVSQIAVKNKTMNLTLNPYSVNMVRVKL
ncbi:alpha-L-arabinofuranosidase C-terminal domain-containing protein [Arcticibacter eurypsychrophilus]|uniref:alpha-L-arabinofuranosidase C-terminal domain-containing protein n=1 Tax=Arcticibacter eurypsychrophilus TaxID=1434752 RepID=UPI00084D3A42|nr:alpha-L-arabinofuranosidase C-terminal domain-containing protein [Arcticibacter eurypsychrophilus]